MFVMSYNIHHGVGMDGKLDLKRIAKEITISRAKVIGLQEVDCHFDERSHFQDQVRELAEIVGMEYTYGPNLILPPSTGLTQKRRYGNALLSAYPISATENVPLIHTGEAEEEPRGVLWAELDVNDSPIHVYVTHLELDEHVRRKQLTQLAMLLNKQEGAKILMGDFNLEPSHGDLQQLLEKTGLSKEEERPSQPTFPANKPQKKIDYILASDHFGINDQFTIPTQASDHLPLVADLKVLVN